MRKKDIVIYDQSAFYKSKIYPLFQKVEEKCLEHKIPYFMTMCIKNSEYESIYILEKELFSDEVILTKNYFPGLQRVYDGAYTIPMLNKVIEKNEKATEYDKEKIFLNEIEPLLFAMKKVCNRLTMPFFFSACVKNSKKDSTYYSDMLATISNYIYLTRDILPDLVNIINDFDPKERIPFELDMDEFSFFDEMGAEKW